MDFSKEDIYIVVGGQRHGTFGRIFFIHTLNKTTCTESLKKFCEFAADHPEKQFVMYDITMNARKKVSLKLVSKVIEEHQKSDNIKLPTRFIKPKLTKNGNR